ncbi:MAG: penicillin acylase family protein [Omnitrophica WOR_2 bacterium]
MPARLRRLLLVLLSVFVIICIALGTVAYTLPRRSFPQTQGEIHLGGLKGPVDIYRDAYGIPQIYAASEHDLFFAEGYVHAQDRFWQMDFWRHIGSGRLSEMFGESELQTDKFLRTMGWARVVQKELAVFDPESKAILDAYAEGVNAYLSNHQGAAISLEYAVLGLLTPGYKPEPWTPLNTMTWAKVMAWDLGGNMDEEIQRAILQSTLTSQQVDELFPPYPSDRPVIVTGLSASASAAHPAGLSPADYARKFAALSPAFAALQKQIDSVGAMSGPSGPGIGSNNWVISGKLTATGKPLLANDPHLSPQMPSIWYEVGLHCVQKTQTCPYEATGFSFAGVPGVIIGHNDRIAWGFTNVGPDVQDLYIEKINPANPNQYEVNGKWVDMQVITETIQVAKGSPVQLTVRYTRHGPLISGVFDLKGLAGSSWMALPEQYGVSLRWTALDISHTWRAVLEIDRAQNWDDFRNAARDFDVPAQNMVYADVDGNIGYQTPGLIPIRAHGDGRYPVPGWTDEYEWTGYIPFDKLPSTFNPSQGFVATANNAVVGPNYPYMITADWDYGFRAQRIVDMIQHAPGPVDIAYIQKMQGDDLNITAQALLPPLMQLSLDDSRLEQARSLLKNWDFQSRMDSAPAALFASFWKHLLMDTFQDKLPNEYMPDGGSRWSEVMSRLIKQPDSSWWDIKSTPDVETRDDIYRKAFGEAVDELTQLQGKDPARWNWGDLHTLTIENQSLGKSPVALINELFNRGPFRTSGGDSIVNATGWAASNSYQVVSVPSMRMIVDLSNLSNSLAIDLTGESGHTYDPHYVDMADQWRNIQYHPMLWDQAQIQSAPGGSLRLLP